MSSGEFMRASIHDQLERARRELLDLTARNRLINTPMGRGRSTRLDLVDELSTEVFRILVQERKEMSFLPIPPRRPADSGPDVGAEDSDGGDGDAVVHLPQPDDEILTDGGLAAHHVDQQLQTALDPEKLQTQLLRLHYDARASEEEQGVNSLFLALGFLEWYEDPNSDKPRYAPLLLLPVALNRKSANAKFRLGFLDEEIVTNLSLQARLKGDFGLQLSDVCDTEELDPAAYFDQVEKLIDGKDRWRVHRDRIVLWFFSFAKFLMFRDLDPDAWPEADRLEDKGLIEGLLGAGFRSDTPVIDDEESLDQYLDPSTLYHVVDADGSQAAAIEEVRTGRSLVIQGPPGTGKSQTISNLIATAVREGKTVLFVAEKLAALEVVKSRLDRIGLGDMCLALHSHKANKKSVLHELSRTLELGKPRPLDFSEQAERLRKHRDELNEYVGQLHRPVSPSMLTPYQVMGRLSKYRSAGVRPLPATINGLEKWSSSTFSEKTRLLSDVLQYLREAPIPQAHPWYGVLREEPLLPSEEQALSTSLQTLEEGLGRLCSACERLADAMAIEWDWERETFHSVQQLALLTKKLLAAPPLDWSSIGHPAWRQQRDRITKFVASVRTLKEKGEGLSSRVSPVAFETELGEARRNLAANGQSWFRWFKKSYRNARQTFLGILTGPAPASLSEQLQLLDGIIEVQQARRDLEPGGTADQLGQSAFGSRWQGVDSAWQELVAICDWETGCREANLRSDFHEIASRVVDLDALRSPLEIIAKDLKLSFQTLQDCHRKLQLDPQRTWGKVDLHRVSPFHALQRIQHWRGSQNRLGRWLVFNRRLRELKEQGLADLLPLLLSGECDPENTLDRLHLMFCELAMRQILKECNAISRFDGTTQDSLVRLFRELDVERITLARREIALAHYDRIPTGGDFGELGIVRGEIRKKRSHRPIRRLLRDAGHAVQAIKPVLMMSPISVAQFLEPGVLAFDLLLIDEASQVRPVEALGSVARCRQVVVVGDERQLPPTQFFDRMGEQPGDETDDVEDGVAAGDVESVLDLCQARNMNHRMLRWHYRSKHQSLIAVSNREFYESKLFVFPSPEFDSQDLGLKFHFVPDGVFDRGGSRTNREEARAVAQAMVDHARRHPNLSLGVGTFSVTQRDAILDELELLRRSELDVDTYFSQAANEPWFVKNLENIQGDERDVIFISVGYARDRNGVPTMNFGPLSKQGGERRLNVLITRAKCRCEVFSSMRADDIDLNRATSRGAASLKTFLKYAESGQIELPKHSGEQPDTEFEAQVADALRKCDFEVHSRVGIAGLFVDLAVIDPAQPGRYLLGIECDGAAYHASRWARDRDRLREQVLVQGHHWKIHRIWSTDWFHSPDEQMKKLLTAIEDAQQCPEGIYATPPAVSETAIERDESSDAVDLDEPEQATYVEVSFSIDRIDVAIPDLQPSELAKVVDRIVQTEGPIHTEEIARRTTSLWGLQRAGSRIAAAVQRALEWSERDGRIEEQRGGFWYAAGRTEFPVRSRETVASSTLRKPEMLPPMEIETAILEFIRSHVSATRDEVARGAGRAFGFKSTSQQLRAVIDVEIARMIKESRITESNERLREGMRPSGVGVE